MDWYVRLSAAYSETHRYYHNQQHIFECLAEFASARCLARQPGIVDLALWFHDAVYDPRSSDNEERSAELAQRSCADAGLSQDAARTVAQLVMATKTHECTGDLDAAMMVDVDLSILGRDVDRFCEYERQIRQEYAWVPDPIFASKRAEILNRFLSRPRLFTTDWFFRKYELQARQNLELSIQNLTSSLA
ncbi:MAG TPA: hypothetical protein DCE44_10815 [Verrucomicrobiales bacterium]|nr:hypothetical protein [Verrucomicrobiales bacterium]